MPLHYRTQNVLHEKARLFLKNARMVLWKILRRDKTAPSKQREQQRFQEIMHRINYALFLRRSTYKSLIGFDYVIILQPVPSFISLIKNFNFLLYIHRIVKKKWFSCILCVNIEEFDFGTSPQ